MRVVEFTRNPPRVVLEFRKWHPRTWWIFARAFMVAIILVVFNLQYCYHEDED